MLPKDVETPGLPMITEYFSYRNVTVETVEILPKEIEPPIITIVTENNTYRNATVTPIQSLPKDIESPEQPIITKYLTYSNATIKTVQMLPKTKTHCTNESTMCLFYPMVTVDETLELRELFIDFMTAMEQVNVPLYLVH